MMEPPKKKKKKAYLARKIMSSNVHTYETDCLWDIWTSRWIQAINHKKLRLKIEV